MPETTSTYEDARKAYWDAEQVFRDVAIAEIQRLIPPQAWGVILDINDTPRLAAVDFVNEEGVRFDAYSYEDDDGIDDTLDAFEQIDQVAQDLNVTDWQDINNDLPRYEPTNEFVIYREES